MNTNNKIEKFSEFKTIYIFDFDKTLAETPNFESTIQQYLVESTTPKDLLYKSLDFVNKNIEDLKWENGRIFIDDPNRKIKIVGNWVRKKKRIYLLAPNSFSQLDESFPTELKELSELYNSVENKCILTARPESTRNKLIKVLNELGLEETPKYGIHMRPDDRPQAGIWKGEKIVEIVKEHGFEYVEYYEDNSKFIRKVKRVIKDKLPDLNFKVIKV